MRINFERCPSKYELQYFIWCDINIDRYKLIKFIKRLNFTKFFSFIPSYKKEYIFLKDILNTYDSTRINGLLNNDENILRICLIEKWARITATDILLNNNPTRTTHTTIVNLPIKDYQLLMKRVEEMVTATRNFTFQSINPTDNLPGL
jgi:hypothetical protein